MIRPDGYEQYSGRMGGLIRLGVSKAIGAESSLSVFQTSLDLSPADRLVCCTDGVSDNLLGEELMEIVRGSANADEASGRVKELVDQHIEQGRDIRFRGGRFRHDDETAIFRFSRRTRPCRRFENHAVVPAKAGTRKARASAIVSMARISWIPASAGMTVSARDGHFESDQLRWRSGSVPF